MWSIGIYFGTSPFDLRAPDDVSNPVLTRESVTDVAAKFVADPFMVRRDSVWYMFFEVLNLKSGNGEIGLATSGNGRDWTYEQIVLAEAFHLSYPYLFEYQNEYYMVPETLRAATICLYKAEDFPRRWRNVGSLIQGSFGDPSIFYFADRWWLFACSTPYQHDTVRLYFADRIMGPWTEHPASPVVEANKLSARPGGRVLVLNDRVIRFAQDCGARYGSQLRAFEISELTTSSYSEKEDHRSPILRATGNGWNGLGMHHADPHLLSDGRWIACVDGFAGAATSDATETTLKSDS